MRVGGRTRRVQCRSGRVSLAVLGGACERAQHVGAPRRPSWPFSRTLGRGRCAGVWTGRDSRDGVPAGTSPQAPPRSPGCRRRWMIGPGRSLSGSCREAMISGIGRLGACHSCGGSSSRWSWRSPVRNATGSRFTPLSLPKSMKVLSTSLPSAAHVWYLCSSSGAPARYCVTDRLSPARGELQAWVGGRIIVNCPSLTVAEVGGDIDDNDLVAIARTRMVRVQQTVDHRREEI